MQQYTSPTPAYAHKPDFTMRVMGYVALAFGIAAIGTLLAPRFIPIEFMAGAGQWIIYIGTLVLAFTSHMWSQMARPMNLFMFSLFALLIGVMFYPLLGYALAVGGLDIVAKAFGITALLTLGAGMYGKTTSRDLSGMGGFFTFAILGLILVSVINAIWYNGMVEAVISGIGVFLFSGLIAYQMNVIQQYPEDRAMEAGIGLFIAIFNLLTSVLRLLLAFNRN